MLPNDAANRYKVLYETMRLYREFAEWEEENEKDKKTYS